MQSVCNGVGKCISNNTCICTNPMFGGSDCGQVMEKYKLTIPGMNAVFPRGKIDVKIHHSSSLVPKTISTSYIPNLSCRFGDRNSYLEHISPASYNSTSDTYICTLLVDPLATYYDITVELTSKNNMQETVHLSEQALAVAFMPNNMSVNQVVSIGTVEGLSITLQGSEKMTNLTGRVILSLRYLMNNVPQFNYCYRKCLFMIMYLH